MSTRVNWTRDEYILALDLYLKYPQTAPAKTDPVLTEYSNYMRMLHTNQVEKFSSRNRWLWHINNPFRKVRGMN